MHNKQLLLTSLSVSSSHPVLSFLFPSWMRWTFQRRDIRTHFVARLSVPLWQQSALYLGRRGGLWQHHQVLIRCEYIVRFHCPSSSDRYITKPIRASEFSRDKRSLSINKPLMVELAIDVSSVRREKQTSDELMVPRKSLCLPPALPSSLWSLKRCCTFNALQPNNLSSFQFS